MYAVYEEKLKRNVVLERLEELKITHTKQGQSIYTLDYAGLKRELALTRFREIDIASDSNRWF